jgi:hypothetical protein
VKTHVVVAFCFTLFSSFRGLDIGVKYSSLGDQMVETAEIDEFVYDPTSVLPPPLEGPLGEIELVLRNELFEMLHFY